MDSTKNVVHPLGMSIEDFRKYGKEMIDYVADYYEQIETFPVRSTVSPGYLKDLIPSTAPEQPETWEAIMSDVQRVILPGITHFQSPRFNAYFPASSSFPGQLAEMLSNCFNPIGFSWINSPALTELETVVMDWLVHLLGLPEQFATSTQGGGCIQGTASEATLVSVLVAREQALERHPKASIDSLVCYTSDQAHSSYRKAFKLAGIRSENVRIVKTPHGIHSMQYDSLKKLIEQDLSNDKIPFFIGATIGTTSATHMDRLDKIGPLCKEFQIAMHVDAAYAGAALVCPEHRYMINGLEYADTFCFNPHKWLLVNFDCSALFVRDRVALENAMRCDQEIYSNEASRSGLVTDYRNWQVPLGRRFRALKLWSVLRMYGVAGLQAHIRRHCTLAKEFDALVRTDDRMEVTAETHLGLVCFRFKGENQEARNALNLKILEELNKDGEIFIVHSEIHGSIFLRYCICSPMMNSEHVKAGFRSIQRVASKTL